MANPSTNFLYWYRRYKVRAADMTQFQTAMVEITRGLAEGGFGQSVLSGLEITPGVGLVINIGSGIATSATGYLCAATGSATGQIATAPTGTLARNDLIVLRPSPVDVDYMQSPTSPNTTVPLHSTQNSSIVIIQGTPASTGSQVYPSAQASDIVLAGVRIPGGTSQLTQTMIDYVVRDRIGKNSNLGNLSAFDYIVTSSRTLSTHKSFAAFCADPTLVAGSRVLVCDSEGVSGTLNISTPNLSIEFLPGVQLSASGAATGISVSASGVQFVRGRMNGFSTGVAFVSGAEYGVVDRMRFKSCTIPIDDTATNSGAAAVAVHTEV